MDAGNNIDNPIKIEDETPNQSPQPQSPNLLSSSVLPSPQPILPRRPLFMDKAEVAKQRRNKYLRKWISVINNPALVMPRLSAESMLDFLMSAYHVKQKLVHMRKISIRTFISACVDEWKTRAEFVVEFARLYSILEEECRKLPDFEEDTYNKMVRDVQKRFLNI